MAFRTPAAIEWIWRDSPSEPDARRIILWWEYRRAAYNAFVGVTGVVSLSLFLAFLDASGRLGLGEDAVEPMALVAAPILANLCYCAGWAAEISLRQAFSLSNRVGPTLLWLGLVFSGIVIALPSTIWFFILIFGGRGGGSQ